MSYINIRSSIFWQEPFASLLKCYHQQVRKWVNKLCGQLEILQVSIGYNDRKVSVSIVQQWQLLMLTYILFIKVMVLSYEIKFWMNMVLLNLYWLWCNNLTFQLVLITWTITITVVYTVTFCISGVIPHFFSRHPFWETLLGHYPTSVETRIPHPHFLLYNR